MKAQTAPVLLALAGFSSLASAAVIDNSPPPWERWTGPGTNQQAIYAVWEFGANTTPVGPDNESLIVTNPIQCPLCSNEISLPAVATHVAEPFAGDFSGGWSFSGFGQIDGTLTNVIDLEPLKIIRTQITWVGTTAPIFVVDAAFDPDVGGTGTIPVDGGAIRNSTQLLGSPTGIQTLISNGGTPGDGSDDVWHGFYLSEIEPNPNNENFRIDVFGGTVIDGIIIDTVSIPEPSSALLLGLGSLGFLLRRRRA